DGALFAVTSLRRALADHGIELAGTIRAGGLRGDAPVVAEHRSIPLADICRVSNKDSNNFVAETIFKTLGRERFGGAATLQKGVRAVEDVLRPLGFGSDIFHIVNGSGLTYENRIRPVGLARLLRHLDLDLAVAPAFLASLAAGGTAGARGSPRASASQSGARRARPRRARGRAAPAPAAASAASAPATPPPEAAARSAGAPPRWAHRRPPRRAARWRCGGHGSRVHWTW